MLRKQHKVDASHYDMPLIYYTEGHSLHFGRPEFALITGLPFGHVNFGLYTSRELKFRNRVFPHKLGLSVTNLDVIGVIEDEEIFQKLCDQDSIRLCLILCLEVIIMGRLLTCSVDDTLFRLNVIEKHSDDHYFGMKRDRMYVHMYTFSGFVFAFQVLIFESFERCNCWWIKDPNVIPRAVGWSKKSIFNRSDCGYLFAKESTTTSDIRPTKAEYESSWWIRSQPKKWIKDEVISQLNLCVFKLETIIQVLARERKNEYGLLQFKDEFSRLGHDFMNSLNILFEELSQPLYTDEKFSNDYLVEEELRLCLEAEERMRLEHEKNIIEEQRFRVNEAKRMKLEEEKLLEISDMPGKTKAIVSWVKINKHRLNVNDPSLVELLKKVKPWVEELSRSFHSLDTVWLTPDIQRFISREGKIKCKFPWSDDYTVGRNFWLTLVCLDPTRKGWLSEEHIDLYFCKIAPPLFDANGDKYATSWSDVDQVFFPINETAQHWYVVPTSRVVVPTGRYVVPAGKVILIVSPGRLNLVPTSRILSPGKVK
ncbi:phospholipase-like protein [Tanacetum coccineum]